MIVVFHTNVVTGYYEADEMARFIQMPYPGGKMWYLFERASSTCMINERAVCYMDGVRPYNRVRNGYPIPVVRRWANDGKMLDELVREFLS